MAHTEMPTTLEGAEAAIKKQEDFMTTMDANEEKINAVVETGRRLVSDGNISSDRIQEKVDSIDDRYSVWNVGPLNCYTSGHYPVLRTAGVRFPVSSMQALVRIALDHPASGTWCGACLLKRRPRRAPSSITALLQRCHGGSPEGGTWEARAFLAQAIFSFTPVTLFRHL